RAVTTVARSRWKFGVPVVLAVAGLLFAVTGTTARGTNLRPGANTRLIDLIQAAQERNDRFGTTGDRLRSQVDRLAKQAEDPQVQEARKEGDAVAPAAGLTAMSGAGLTVT